MTAGDAASVYGHLPVLPNEVLHFLSLRPGPLVVDGTVGLGGHAEQVLDADDAAELIGIDRDEAALARAAERLARYGNRVRLVHANYREIGRVLDQLNVPSVDAVLLDIGVSSLQLDDPNRGFSFRSEGPLDMRMDRSRGPTAAEWLAGAEPREIEEILFRYGEERHARRIARAIVAARTHGTLESTSELAAVIRRAVPGAGRQQRIDPATRSFQALRIVVNEELAHLEAGLAAAFDRLSLSGILAVISFHSLEDRIVKTFLRTRAASCVCPPDLPVCVCSKRVEAEILTRKPVTASDEERAQNPRARSAKLRAARKVV